MESEIVEGPIVIPISDSSRVAEVRRLVTSLGGREELDENTISDAAVVATELATNLARYAQRGEIHLLPLSERGLSGIELLAVDRGPGVDSFQKCLVDGYSTSGTQGTGLGAVQRLTTAMDVYSLPGRGTVISAVLQSKAIANITPPILSLGVAARPVAGETVSGDAWATKARGSSTLLIVADGLGHGASAAEAAREAILRFLNSNGATPAELLTDVHHALRGTRGAAVSIAEVDFDKGKVVFAGLGNVAGVILRGVGQSTPRLHGMVSQNGTAGHEARHFKEFEYSLHVDDIVVLHSDGLSTHWKLQDSPGLLRKQPSVIAGTLYRDYARDRDDVCVVVGRKT